MRDVVGASSFISLILVVCLVTGLACLPAPVGGQPDSDDDGVPDASDAFPNTPYEHKDTDGDGVGDNLDEDADGDGTPDERDAFPMDDTESLDTDGDGTGDNTDKDDDNDGVADISDAFPRNPTEFQDADGDGVGDHLDPDDDNDGIADDQEWAGEASQELTNLSALVAALQASVRDDLDGLEASLGAKLADLSVDTLKEPEGVNSSLAEEVRTMAAAATADLGAMGVTISSDVDDLGSWVDEVVDTLEAMLEGANASLRSRMDVMEGRNTGFFNTLGRDLTDLMGRLAAFEGNMSAGDDDIRDRIAPLSEMTSDMNGHTLSELS